MKRSIILLLGALLLSTGASAQNLEDNIEKFTSANGKRYLQPLADVFGANLNSGFYHTAKIPKFGLHVRVGLSAMMAPVSSDQKTFTTVAENGFPLPAGTELPTLFGDEDPVNLGGVQFGGVWDTEFFPLAVPQITIGSFMGTEMTFRYIKYKVDDSFGDIRLQGWGIRHSLSQYIFLCPVDIAASYYHQKFDIGNYVEATAVYYGIQASKSLGPLTVYGGFAFEKSTLTLQYDYVDTATQIHFDLEGENSTRTTLGVALDLFIFKIYGDMNIASQTTYSAGIGLGF